MVQQMDVGDCLGEERSPTEGNEAYLTGHSEKEKGIRNLANDRSANFNFLFICKYIYIYQK